MGLKLTLSKENNPLYYDFVNAYWAITNINYTVNQCIFKLEAFPSRDAKYKTRTPLEGTTLPIGCASSPMFETNLYEWDGTFMISDIFPSGIPLDANEQKTAVYNFIKSYTSLPFEDVFED